MRSGTLYQLRLRFACESLAGKAGLWYSRDGLVALSVQHDARGARGIQQNPRAAFRGMSLVFAVPEGSKDGYETAV